VIAKQDVSVVVLPGEVVLMKIDDDVPEWIAPTAQRSHICILASPRAFWISNSIGGATLTFHNVH
jgi:hypothetical protein